MTDQAESGPGCVFCAIVAGDLPCWKVAEDESTFAFMDIDPGSDGHLHVMPRYVDKVNNKDRLELLYEPGHPIDADALAEQARKLAAVL